MESPCVSICVIDPRSDTCEGCGRTIGEITNWVSYTSAERRRIMTELPQRMERLRAGLAQ